MSAQEKIKFGGLGLVSTTQKTLDRSTTYDHLFPKPNWEQKIVRRDGLVTDVVEDMKNVIFGYRNQSKEFAPHMRGINIYETCRNIWKFWYNRCAYKEDQKGLEQLRTVARSYWEGAGFAPDAVEDDFGIDCDDFSIAVSQTLLNLSIPHFLRIARFAGVDFFQHVYVVLIYNGREIIIDCVLDQFDQEKPPIEQKDFLIMDKHNFNGIDVAILSGIGDTAPLLDVVTGSDFNSIGSLGETPDEKKELDALYQHILKTRQLVAENPELVKEVENPQQYLQMLDYALYYWNTDKRDEALAILASREDQANALRGFSPGSDTNESEIELRGLPDGGYEAIGKIGGQRKFFNKVKEAAKKVGQGVKKVAVAAVKYNPLTIAARAGVLLAMKTNLFHYADHLKWGYLTESEAKEQGFDMEEWKKAKEANDNTKNMFVKILQGDENNLKHTILTGRAGNLASVNLGSLGIEPISTAASTAAATGFLAKINDWIKKIDLKKMLKKVDVKKLAAKAQAMVTMNRSAGGEAPPPAGDQGDQSNQKGTDPPPPDEPSSLTTALPWIGAGVLAIWALSSSGKKSKQVSGLNGVGKKKKKVSKAPKFSNYESEILAGISHVESDNYSESSYKPKKKGKSKSKIKKMKLR